jgi:hypothetical protein
MLKSYGAKFWRASDWLKWRAGIEIKVGKMIFEQ